MRALPEGVDACCIGEVTDGGAGKLRLRTAIGGVRAVITSYSIHYTKLYDYHPGQQGEYHAGEQGNRAVGRCRPFAQQSVYGDRHRVRLNH